MPILVPQKSERPYTFVQPSPATVWTVVHNLGRHPIVEVYDTAGTQIFGSLVYDNDDQVTLTFSAAFSGFVQLI